MPVNLLSVDASRTIRLAGGRTFSAFDGEMVEAAKGEAGLANIHRFPVGCIGHAGHAVI